MTTASSHSAVLEGRGWPVVLLVALAGAALFVLLTRPLLNHIPTYDELLHALPARGVVATGEPVMADGEYRRAELYTRAVAWAYVRFGDDLVSARLPAWACAIALVALLGGWVTRRLGLLAGLCSAVILAVTPSLFQSAVLARFYAPHALCALGALIALYEAFVPARPAVGRLTLIGLAALFIAVAWHLQIITIVTLGAGVAGLLALAAFDHGASLRALFHKHRRAVLAGGAVLLALGAGAALIIGRLLLDWLGGAPLWVGEGNRPDYYLRALREQMPLLTPLLPVAVAVALLVNRRLALYCTVVVLAGLVAHSIAPFKASRYILYLMPLMAALWGGALAAGVMAVARKLRARTRLPPLTAQFAALAAVLVVFANSREGVLGAKLLLNQAKAADVLPYASEGDWRAATAVLKPLRERASVVIASSGVKALDALGDYGYELNLSVVAETDTGDEFGLDLRTGRRVIGTVQSLERVLQEPGRALVVADAEKVGDAAGIVPEVVQVLSARCSEVPGLADSRLRAWTCE